MNAPRAEIGIPASAPAPALTSLIFVVSNYSGMAVGEHLQIFHFYFRRSLFICVGTRGSITIDKLYPIV